MEKFRYIIIHNSFTFAIAWKKKKKKFEHHNLLNVKEDYIMLQQLVLLDNMELVMVHTVTLIATLVVEGW